MNNTPSGAIDVSVEPTGQFSSLKNHTNGLLISFSQSA